MTVAANAAHASTSPANREPPTSGGLRAPPSRLIGREKELEDASRRLLERGVRLLTLTGPGGIGKTRLALTIAECLRDHFEPVVFVDLAQLRYPTLLLSSISQAIALAGADARLLREGVGGEATDRELLVVLDTCEHVLAAAPQLANLLETCPRLKVLATSREPLRLRWEHQYAVRPLMLPTLGDGAAGELERVPAVGLFLERARAVRADFRLDARNSASVIELCRQLDGQPLALELAAARTKVLSPAAIVARLADRLDLLRREAYDAPERHRTLRSMIDWSHVLLDTSAQVLFRRLGVFRGDFTVGAAVVVCATGADWRVMLDSLEQLVDKSLLHTSHASDGQPRFQMLETVRLYALEKLLASPEAGELQRRFVGYYVALAERAELGLAGPDQLTWLDHLEREQDNLHAALEWCARGEGDADLGLRLISALLRYWTTRGRPAEAETCLQAVLERGGGSPQHRARALAAACVVADVRTAACLPDSDRAPLSLPAAAAAGPPRSAPTRNSADARLTRREREIASLVARGLTNRQIAEELIISRETAGAHIKHTLRKLGFSSRAQIAAWAVQQGLGVLQY